MNHWLPLANIGIATCNLVLSSSLHAACGWLAAVVGWSIVHVWNKERRTHEA